jgi:hypothetical protein
MNRRRIFFTSTIIMLAITITVAGFAFYSNFTASAFVQGAPDAAQFFPVQTQAVFGMNIQRFTTSPIYARIMQQHERDIGRNLAEFSSKTGVDPGRDIKYILGGAWSSHAKEGVVIAVGTFNRDAILSFMNSKGAPIRADYEGVTILMFPEAGQLQKGVAFLSDSEIALGTLDGLHSILDVRSGKVAGIASNATMRDLLGRVGPTEMFWFAGDASILSKLPMPRVSSLPNLTAIQNVFGTLSCEDVITGKVNVTAKDPASAQQLADFARGMIALGGLASAQNPELAQLASCFHITQTANQFEINIAAPFELLEKLQENKAGLAK